MYDFKDNDTLTVNILHHAPTVGIGLREREREMAWRETVRSAEKLVEIAMKENDASHDAAHSFRVRDLALSLAHEEGLSASPDSLEVVELAALFHDIGDYKYLRDPSEEKIVENFLEKECIEECKKLKILEIINGMGFKEEIAGLKNCEYSPEFGVVQDADRLDAIGAIGIARCFTFGGSRNRALHDPKILPRTYMSKEQYMKKDEQTTINHFHEKLFKLIKHLMILEVDLMILEVDMYCTVLLFDYKGRTSSLATSRISCC